MSCDTSFVRRLSKSNFHGGLWVVVGGGWASLCKHWKVIRGKLLQNLKLMAGESVRLTKLGSGRRPEAEIKRRRNAKRIRWSNYLQFQVNVDDTNNALKFIL